MRIRGLATLAPLVLSAVVGCASGTPTTPDAAVGPVERIPVSIESENGEVRFLAEVADTPSERARGLMERASMDPEHGMLFLFPREQHLSFWMRNTWISLDMVFIRADRTILGVVAEATPRTDARREVPGDAQFVLELNGGVAAQKGIKAGQSVSFYAPLPSQ